MGWMCTKIEIILDVYVTISLLLYHRGQQNTTPSFGNGNRIYIQKLVYITQDFKALQTEEVYSAD
jgi:hypothetical protein